MRTSSSLCTINGDCRLGVSEKIPYYFLNAIEHLKPQKGALPNLAVAPFRLSPEEFQRALPLLEPNKSPARILSDLFWATRPWKKWEELLGPLHLVDSGCGRGEYARKLLAASQGTVKSYLGFDAKERNEWRSAWPGEVSFRQASAEGIEHLIPKQANMLVSQSAIEHFPRDLDFFRGVANFLGRNKPRTPFLQVHLFPSPICLWLYGTHGYRQYTLRTVERIVEVFPTSTTAASLSLLGGHRCNLVHGIYITLSERLRLKSFRKSNLERYSQASLRAVEQDVCAAVRPASIRSASFLALELWHKPTSA